MMHGCISVFVVVDIINDNTVSPSPLERGLGGEARNDIHINNNNNNNNEEESTNSVPTNSPE